MEQLEKVVGGGGVSWYCPGTEHRDVSPSNVEGCC